MQRQTQLANELWPLLLPRVERLLTQAGAGAGGGAATLAVHDLAGANHRGALADDQGPQFLLRNGTRSLTGNLAVDPGVTIDGVDISENIHPRLHDITSVLDHTVTGATWQVVGLTNANTLGLLTPSSDPGQAKAILATDTNGSVTLRNVFAGQAVQSSAVFASGFAGSGWRADYGITTASRASIETDDLTVRGRMRVYELLIQQIRATNGSLFVTSASKVVSVTTANNPAWNVNGVRLTLNGSNANFLANIYTISTAAVGDSSRELYHGFLYGDMIRAQQVQWNGTQFAGVMQSNLEVTGIYSLSSYQAAYVSGDAPAAGYDYVRLGNAVDGTRRGSVYITSDDSAAPFIDIVDGVVTHGDWNSAAVRRVRLGKLSGISDSAFGGTLSGYGLYGNNVYLRGQMIITGGSLGGLAAADVNSNTTTIDGGRITANSVTAAQIAAGTITGDRIAAGTITAAKIAANTITANEIASGTVTGDRLSLTSYLSINSNTFGAAGMQVQYNAGAPRFYVGDGASAFLKFEAGTGYPIASGIRIDGASYVTGSVYAGNGNIRLTTDGQRMLLSDTTAPNVPTNSSAVRWFTSLTATYNNSGLYADNYAGFVAYRHTHPSYQLVDLLLTSYVGSTNASDYDARVVLQAGHNRGGTYEDALLVVARNRGTSDSTISAICTTVSVSNNLYVTNNCSVGSFTDRTPAYAGDALADLRRVKADARGGIDHDSLPAFARRTVRRPDGRAEEGRDIGAMISILTKAVQELDARIDALGG